MGLMLNKTLQYLLCIVLTATYLTACGGGGSGGTADDDAGGTSGSGGDPSGLVFSQDSALVLYVGQVVSSPASGPGTGAITYSSSDTGVATVDDSGNITAVAVGESTITAEQAADASHDAGSATLDVSVVAASFTLTAWLGKSNALVDFSPVLDGLEFYRSTDSDCDLSSYATCTFGQMDVLAGASVTDTAANASRSAFYSFVLSDKQVALTLAVEDLPAIEGLEVNSLGGRLFAVGGWTGYEKGGGDDVWVSEDGQHWAQIDQRNT